MEYRELGQSLTPFISGIPVAFQSVPFSKEPEFGQRKIVRGILKFGDGTNHFVPFILDRAQGTLYLDLTYLGPRQRFVTFVGLLLVLFGFSFFSLLTQ